MAADPGIGPALLAAALMAFLMARLGASPGLVLWILGPTLGILVGLQLLQPGERDFRIPPEGELLSLPESERVPLDLSSDLQTLDGEVFTPESLPGDLLLVNYWATWCRPCREEMPSLDRLHRELGEAGLLILAVTEESPDRVRQFLKANPYAFRIAVDPSGDLRELLRVRALPTTVVLDGSGKIMLTHVGFRDWSSPESLRFFREALGLGNVSRKSWQVEE